MIDTREVWVIYKPGSSLAADVVEAGGGPGKLVNVAVDFMKHLETGRPIAAERIYSENINVYGDDIPNDYHIVWQAREVLQTVESFHLLEGTGGSPMLMRSHFPDKYWHRTANSDGNMRIQWADSISGPMLNLLQKREINTSEVKAVVAQEFRNYTGYNRD